MMNSSLRKLFNIYVVDNQVSQAQQLCDPLEAAGFRCRYFSSYPSMLVEAPEDPPHIVFASASLGDHFLQKLFHQVAELLPETHVIVSLRESGRDQASELIKMGAYDVLTVPLNHPIEVVRMADRAAERDFYMYKTEQLESELQQSRESTSELGELTATTEMTLAELEEAPTQILEVPNLDVTEQSVDFSQVAFSAFNQWMDRLGETKSIKDAVQCVLDEISLKENDASVLFFKYLSSYQSLVASQSAQFDLEAWRGLGIQLGEQEPNFKMEMLSNPETLTSLLELVHDGLQVPGFYALPVENSGGVKGVIVVMTSSPQREREPYLQACLHALEMHTTNLDREKLLHSVNQNDEATMVLNRHVFMQRVGEEISRARRLRLPVSLVIASLDSVAGEGSLPEDAEESKLLVRMVAGILKKCSRVNDVVGRLGPAEFGLLLAHTGKKGGAIKAERLRRMIETADFSKSLPGSPKITLSLGVSEYPSHCQDADDILQMADEALYEVKKVGNNKVCLASAPAGFVPDFNSDDH